MMEDSTAVNYGFYLVRTVQSSKYEKIRNKCVFLQCFNFYSLVWIKKYQISSKKLRSSETSFDLCSNVRLF